MDSTLGRPSELDDGFVTRRRDRWTLDALAAVDALDPERPDDRTRCFSLGPDREGVLYAGGDKIRSYDSSDGEQRWTWEPNVDVEGVVPAAAFPTPCTWLVDGRRPAEPIGSRSIRRPKRPVGVRCREQSDRSVRRRNGAYVAAADTVYALE